METSIKMDDLGTTMDWKPPYGAICHVTRGYLEFPTWFSHADGWTKNWQYSHLLSDYFHILLWSHLEQYSLFKVKPPFLKCGTWRMVSKIFRQGGLLRRERWASTPWIVLCPRKRKTGVTWKQSGWMMKLRSSEKSLGNAYLVGGLEHEFYDFPSSWECHHINWQTPSFFRGVGTPPTRYCIICRYIYII